MLTSWTTPRQVLFRGAVSTQLSWRVGRCEVVVWVMRDEPRVFIGGGEFGVEGVREADLVEIESLAERFKSVELMAVVDRIRARNTAT